MISSSFPIQLGCLADEDAHRQIRINGRIMGGNSRAKHGGVHGAGAFCGHRRMCVHVKAIQDGVFRWKDGGRRLSYTIA